MTMMGQAMTYERHIDMRTTLPYLDLLDVSFTDAVGELETVMRCVCEFVDEDLSEDVLRNMMAWEKRHPMH